jgi:hypothetical protein
MSLDPEKPTHRPDAQMHKQPVLLSGDVGHEDHFSERTGVRAAEQTW